MMNKKQTLFRVSSLLLVLCMVSTVMLSGTFAKYTSTYAGQDTALIAKWDFKVSDGTTDLGAGSDASTDLDLFSHAFGTHLNSTSTEGVSIIAPGVEDEFTIKMKFLSDVDATVTVDFATGAGTTVDATLPIIYSVDGSNWVSLEDLPDAFATQVVASNVSITSNPLNNTFTFKKSAVTAGSATEISQIVKWKWAFVQTDVATGDAIDTALGAASAAGARTAYVLKATVTAEQIAPAL